MSPTVKTKYLHASQTTRGSIYDCQVVTVKLEHFGKNISYFAIRFINKQFLQFILNFFFFAFSLETA